MWPNNYQRLSVRNKLMIRQGGCSMTRLLNYFLFIFFIIYCGATSILSPLKAAPAPTTDRVLILSDLHFNPLASCSQTQLPCPLATALKDSAPSNWETLLNETSNQPIPVYGKDTNFVLLQKTLQEAKNISQQSNIAFILNPGDFLAHNFCNQYKYYTNDQSKDGCKLFAEKTMRFIALELRKTFPQVPVYAALGNNDAYTGDYSILPNSQFFDDTAISWSKLFLTQSNRINFLKQFIHSGYYEIIPPTGYHERLIVLDTTPFSPKATSDRNVQQIALAELNWLNKNLTLAKMFHQEVWILLHIPAGIDVYASEKNHKIISYWKQPYTELFLSILAQYSNTVKGVFAGHSHMDMFNEIAEPNKQNIPVIITPSISPVFGNNPAIKVVSFDESDFTPTDYSVYNLDLSQTIPSWNQEYQFDESFNEKKQSIAKVYKDLLKNPAFKNGKLALQYEQDYSAGSANNQLIKKEYKQYWCAIQNLIPEQYKKCVD